MECVTSVVRDEGTERVRARQIYPSYLPRLSRSLATTELVECIYAVIAEKIRNIWTASLRVDHRESATQQRGTRLIAEYEENTQHASWAVAAI